jgi:hypothetical protein
MLRRGLWGLAVVVALGGGAAPAAAARCRRLCAAALRTCRPSEPCSGLKGGDAVACRRRARALRRSCRDGILATCRTTGACA